jgi:hypothetical protein
VKPALVPAAVSNGERLARRALGCALDDEVSRRARIEAATANPLMIERAVQAIRIAPQKSDAVDADVSEQAHQRH